MQTDEQVARTAKEMLRLIEEYPTDVHLVGAADARDIYDFAHSLPFRRDADFGFDEVLQRPAITAERGGDCDDKVILAATLLDQARIPWRMVFSSYRPSKILHHVYLELKDGRGIWIPFDATYPQNQFGKEIPGATRKVFGRSLMTEFYPYSDQNVTLEGIGDGEDFGFLQRLYSGLTAAPGFTSRDQVSTEPPGAELPFETVLDLAKQAPVIGQIVGAASLVVDGLKKLPLIGSLFRGKTQHMPYDAAKQKADQSANALVQFYDTLSQDGKNLLFVKMRDFFNEAVRIYGHEWGGHLASEAQKVRAQGFIEPSSSNFNAREAIKSFLTVPLMTFLTQTDIDGETERAVNDVITRQVSAIISDVASQPQLTSTGQVISTVTSPKGILALTLIGGGVLALFLLKKKHGRPAF